MCVDGRFSKIRSQIVYLCTVKIQCNPLKRSLVIMHDRDHQQSLKIIYMV